jgi:hypothetical protein
MRPSPAVREGIRALFWLNRPGGALEISERGRGRFFVAELLAHGDIVPNQVPPDLRERGHNARRALTSAWRKKEGQSADRLLLDAAVERAKHELDAVYNLMEPYAPNFVAIRRARPTSIKELAPILVHSDRIYREWQIQDPESYLVILGGNRKEVEVTRLVVSSQELQRYLDLLIEDFWTPPENEKERLSPGKL